MLSAARRYGNGGWLHQEHESDGDCSFYVGDCVADASLYRTGKRRQDTLFHSAYSINDEWLHEIGKIIIPA
jgi:hypothetical protein